MVSGDWRPCKYEWPAVVTINNELSVDFKKLESVSTHVASCYLNFWDQRKRLPREKSSVPTGLVWDNNMVAVSLFWDTDMANVTSCIIRLYSSMLLTENTENKVTVRATQWRNVTWNYCFQWPPFWNCQIGNLVEQECQNHAKTIEKC